jgi:hypothetical protein
MEETKKRTAKKHMLLLTLSIVGILVLLSVISILTTVK